MPCKNLNKLQLKIIEKVLYPDNWRQSQFAAQKKT